MKTVQQYLQINPAKGRQHFLFNLLNFLYFRKSDYENPLSIESHPLSLFVAIPYVMFTEAYFFRQKRYFITREQQIVGILALQERTDTLYVSSLAVSPFYRKIGVATYILNYAAMMAGRLHKDALELSVVKANTPALRLYKKYGFRQKKEKRRSFILRKNLKND